MSDVESRRICLENWPKAESGAYDPRCCRFPKSCSVPPENEKQIVADWWAEQLADPDSPFGTLRSGGDR